LIFGTFDDALLSSPNSDSGSSSDSLVLDCCGASRDTAAGAGITPQPHPAGAAGNKSAAATAAAAAADLSDDLRQVDVGNTSAAPAASAYQLGASRSSLALPKVDAQQVVEASTAAALSASTAAAFKASAAAAFSASAAAAVLVSEGFELCLALAAMGAAAVGQARSLFQKDGAVLYLLSVGVMLSFSGTQNNSGIDSSRICI
jgi:hypothetical protein